MVCLFGTWLLDAGFALLGPTPIASQPLKEAQLNCYAGANGPSLGPGIEVLAPWQRHLPAAEKHT